MTLPPNALWELKKDADIETIPRSPTPFYVLAKEGVYLRKATALGFGTIKIDGMPKSLGAVGYPKGYFEWDAPVIPAVICAQIVDFFRRIWDKHKAEAEVILTATYEMIDGYPKIKDYRVFIPTQKVSGGGVQSVYEPTHIDSKKYLIIGTMHSHCNFSAYHSGTDTGDAQGMDGLHLTIGYVDKADPQVASMVSVNGMHIDYKPEVVADFSDLDAGTAPAWWDNYVQPTKDLATNHRPAGWSNFDKYKAPLPATPNYGTHGGNYGGGNGSGYGHGGGYYGGGGGYNANNWAARPPAGNTPILPPVTKPGTVGTKTLKQIRDEQDAKKALLPADTKGDYTAESRRDYTQAQWNALMDEAESAYWEDNIEAQLRNLIFDNGLLTDDDVDDLAKNKVNSESFLRVLMLHKLRASRNVLQFLGVDVEVTVKNVLRTPEGNLGTKLEATNKRPSATNGRRAKKGVTTNAKRNSRRNRF